MSRDERLCFSDHEHNAKTKIRLRRYGSRPTRINTLILQHYHGFLARCASAFTMRIRCGALAIDDDNCISQRCPVPIYDSVKAIILNCASFVAVGMKKFTGILHMR